MTYIIKAIPMLIPVSVFIEIEKSSLKIHMEPQKTLITKTIEQEQDGAITLHDFREYYKTTVMETEGNWHKSKHADLWNKIKSPEIDPLT